MEPDTNTNTNTNTSTNTNIQNKYIKNKRKRIESCLETFVLNTMNTHNYYHTDPDELIIIDTSENYIKKILQSIVCGGIKQNVKKIITSDSVIVKYFACIEKLFSILYPNCLTIQVNSFSNNFSTISTIIDNFTIVENIEYKLNNYVFMNNSVIKYKYFFESFFTGSLSNIKYVKIINDIDIDTGMGTGTGTGTGTGVRNKKVNCVIEKNQITNIIVQSTVDEINKLQSDYIINFNIDKSFINNLHLEYVDNKRNVHFEKYIINIVDTDFIEDDLYM